MKLRLLLVLCLTLGLSVIGSAALAAGPGGYTCDDGMIPASTYTSLTVTGNCYFGPGDVIVNGNVTVKDGAVLNDHANFSQADSVTINGNVKVDKGAVLGLGLYCFSASCPDLNITSVDTTVNGNIIANQPKTLYISFTTVHGNVISNGGGTTEFLNFPTKDNVIDGNLVIQGWHGGWLGVIRNEVGGNVIVSKNKSVVIETPEGCDAELGECTGYGPGTDSDSTEVQTNQVHGNLICQGNTPEAQVNDFDGGQPNTVDGKAIGQCADLVGVQS